MKSLKVHEGKRRGRPTGGCARYLEIAGDLRKRLSGSEWPTGKRIPSFRNLALHYAVSIKSIQRAVAVLKSEGHLCVRPDRPTIAAIGAPLAKILESGIAVVLRNSLQEMHHGSGLDLWHGIVKSVEKSGCALVVLQHLNRWRHEFPAGLSEMPLKGVLLPGPHTTDSLRQYESLKLPVVLLDQPGEEFKINSVSVANYKGAYDATMRLITLKHRRLAFVSYFLTSIHVVDPDARERQAGFVAACKQAGLKEEQYKVFMAGLSPSSAAVSEILRTRPAFTGIVTANPFHATMIEREAGAQGLQIARDLSVAAFGPKHIPGRNWSGPRIDFTEFGALGMKLLQRQPAEPEHIRVRPVWHDGDSVGPCKRG
jgi:DNA-binding LacI/PurR family transcriptional regulator